MSLKQFIQNRPFHNTTLPSTGQEVSFHPFTMGEQKLLYTAAESNDSKVFISTIQQIVKKGLVDKDVKLTKRDLDWVLLKMRSVSVGNVIELIKEECSTEDCDGQPKGGIDLEKIVMGTVEDETPLEKPIPEKNFVEYGDGSPVRIVFKEPSADDYIHFSKWNTPEDVYESLVYDRFLAVTKSVSSGEVVVDSFDDKEEWKQFVDNLPVSVGEAYEKWIDSIPTVVGKATYTCPKCATRTEHTIEGIEDFFG